MDHIFCFKPSAGGDHGLAGLAAALPVAYLDALVQYLRPSRAVDRAVYPASAQQRRIGGIYDSVRILFGDVPLHEMDPVWHNWSGLESQVLLKLTQKFNL
jgi:hypothetical protein